MPPNDRPSAADTNRLLLATRSPDKASEIRAILGSPLANRLTTLDQAAVARSQEEDSIEVFDTFVENAVAKALYFLQRTGIPTLADDSGLVVPALNGRPGVRSRRFSGRTDLTGTQLDLANNSALLHALESVPASRRIAHYTCAAALALPDRPPITSVGIATGTILREPRGNGGFGYDPLFLATRLGRTFAELEPSAKNRVSHRGRALLAIAVALRDIWPAAS